MPRYRKLTHAIYRCDYHIVFVPKYRYRVVLGTVAEQMDRDIRTICSWREVDVMELSVQPDHVHLVCSVPPKIALSSFVGLLKGKLAIKMFKSHPPLRKTVLGKSFLGARVLRDDRGCRRRTGSPIRTAPGRER